MKRNVQDNNSTPVDENDHWCVETKIFTNASKPIDLDTSDTIIIQNIPYDQEHDTCEGDLTVTNDEENNNEEIVLTPRERKPSKHFKNFYHYNVHPNISHKDLELASQ